MANFSFNKIMIGGRLTADPENSQTPSGVSVAKFSVAVNRKAKEQQTDFFNITAWRGTADFVSKYFKKGSSIFVVGTLQNRSWTDQNGQKRYATDIVAEEVNFVDGKNDNAGTYVPEAYTDAPKLDVVPEGEDLPF